MVSIKEEPVPDVGVLVGRFQVPDLHEGHRDILDYVGMRHDKAVVFLGNNATKISTIQNPLDFQARKQMIVAEYPEFEVLYIEDMWSDKLWSAQLDRQIANVVGPRQSVMLYGSRESFLDHYVGRHPTQELEAEKKLSGTAIRDEVRRSRSKDSPIWREGAIWAANQRFDTTYTTVDIAVFSEDGKRIVLGRKEHENLWRLPGGFAEPWSESFEQDARREAHEELNIEITEPVYVASFKVDDWRYQAERDKIKTLLFAAKHFSGRVVGADDLPEADWFDVRPDGEILVGSNGIIGNIDSLVMPNHRPFVRAAIEHVQKKGI